MINFQGLKIQPEVSDNRFSMVNDGSTEIETSELLYSFVRRLKPSNVLETGCYKGVSSLYMAQALKDNGFGHLTTIEYEQLHIDESEKLWQEAGVKDYVTAVRLESLKFQPDKQYQFMFLDTEMNLRLHELVKFFPYLDEGGYVFIHDMPNTLCFGNKNEDHPNFINWPVGEFPPEFDELLRTDKLRLFHFGGARGLIGFYKTKEGDYKW